MTLPLLSSAAIIGRSPLTSKILLSDSQLDFIDLDKKYKAYVAGYGSGKTFVGCVGLSRHFARHPKILQGYFAPTYPLIRDIFYPTIDEAAFLFGMRTTARTSNKEVDFYRGARNYGTVICRTMHNFDNIAGFEIGNALVDELDLMPTQKATGAWRKIIGRLRLSAPGVENGIAVTTTPEGYRFVYQAFKRDIKADPAKAKYYGIVHGSTYENEANLPEDYIPSLIATYPRELVEAYINGQFVNLTSGAVYGAFSRKTHSTTETIKPNEPLHIGLDFNVGKMAAVIFVIRGDMPLALAELTSVHDTPAMIYAIKGRWPGHPITIYPDASGNSRKSQDASASDFTLLHSAGFAVRSDYSNPRIRDRVMAVNALISNNLFRINTENCPVATRALEQQVYDRNGDPDKQHDTDHPTDALGYFIVQRYPIKRPAASHHIIAGGY